MSTSRIEGASAPVPLFPATFNQDNVTRGRYNPESGNAALTALCRQSFQLLHSGRLDDPNPLVVRAQQNHPKTKSSGTSRRLFGGRSWTFSYNGTLIGFCCMGINHLLIPDATVDVSLCDLIVHNQAGAESGLGKVILDDLEESMAAFAGPCGNQRRLSILLTRETFGSVLLNRGFKHPSKKVKSLAHGPVSVYTKSYGTTRPE